ncbi:MAG: hypothetical protein WC356_07735 [Candidatus Micrarchaeia archaeon]|jgi:predicted nucleic-acid-binding protein
MVNTTIQIEVELLKKLKNRKMYESETYNELIEDLLEDTLELSENIKKEIIEAIKEAKKGKVKSIEQIEKELGF